MKKLLGICLSLAVIGSTFLTPDVKAQSTRPPEVYTKVSKDTSKNADTVALAFLKLDSKVQTLTATVDKVSGTINTASKVYLQGRIVNTWDMIDSLTLADVARNQKTFKLTSLDYIDYRLNYITPASTQTSILSFTYVRRP